jgi:hypothetical protein
MVVKRTEMVKLLRFFLTMFTTRVITSRDSITNTIWEDLMYTVRKSTNMHFR